MARLSTTAAFNFDSLPFEPRMRAFYELGCRSSQFYRNESNPPPAQDARIMADAVGLPLDSIHGIFGPNYDPSSPDEAARLEAVRVYEREGELAVQLGAPMVVVHPARSVQENEPPIDDRQRAQRIEPLERTLRELARIGSRLGVVYLLENIPPYQAIGHDPLQLAQMIRQADHPSIRMCFDTGHANMVGDPAALLDGCLDVVAYLHVHDNDGKSDSHLVPGKGTIPWEKIAVSMRRLPPDTIAMVELFDSAQELQSLAKAGAGEQWRRWLAIA